MSVIHKSYFTCMQNRKFSAKSFQVIHKSYESHLRVIYESFMSHMTLFRAPTHNLLQVIHESYTSHTRVINRDALSSGKKQRIKWRIPKQHKEQWEQMLPPGRRGSQNYEYGFTRAVNQNNLTAPIFHRVKRACLVGWGPEKYLSKLRDVGLCEESAFHGRGYNGDIETNKIKLVQEMCHYYKRKFPRSVLESTTAKQPAQSAQSAPPRFRCESYEGHTRVI